MNVHAQWGTVSSDTVSVFVRPRLTAKRGDVRVFEETKVTGRVVPGRGGSHVDVTLWTNGKPVARTMPMVRRDGTFSTAIEVTDFGTHSFVVRYQDGQHSPVSWRSTPAKTSMPPRVQQGSSGPVVVLLERRLAELHYRVYAQDRTFDYHDSDAVLAFHKVQGMERDGMVDDATWRALAHPKTPRIVGPKTGTHWEVDLTKQVLYLVTDGVPVGIMHISSGKPSTPTHPGWFHVWTKQAGTNDKGMYYSSFFDGNRALHGYPEVPPYAASHGCVRIPMWNALWVWDRAPYGRLVVVHW
jgi:lipoprotein-anchoring transpeptidase ErfK/SrfK